MFLLSMKCPKTEQDVCITSNRKVIAKPISPESSCNRPIGIRSGKRRWKYGMESYSPRSAWRSNVLRSEMDISPSKDTRSKKRTVLAS